MDWHLVLLSFALIFPVELPDKTFVAALVLSTRYRPLAVWIGVGLAFGDPVRSWPWLPATRCRSCPTG